MNTEVWRLRTVLKTSGLDAGAFLQSDHDCIGFREDCDHWVDAAEFDAATSALSVRPALPENGDALSALAAAIGLYRGDLVEGLFDEWRLVEREAYRARYMAALDLLLAATMELKRWQEAVRYGQRLLQLDPLQGMSTVGAFRKGGPRDIRPASGRPDRVSRLYTRRPGGAW